MTKMLPILRENRGKLVTISQTRSQQSRSPSGKRPVVGILDVNDVISTKMPFAALDRANTTNVASTSNHGSRTDVPLDEVGDLLVLKVEFDGIVDTNARIRVTNGSAIVRNDVRNATETQGDALHFEKLVIGLFRSDAMGCEATLHVVDKSEVLVGLVDAHDIYKKCMPFSPIINRDLN